ncbi:hypothetical protein FSP39_014778 [Pinctada imbricata]|uniref:Uncharacterized protein n=1 Tax=Pinctada imbricata TaxID=66713 RepID=A0AA89BZF2_PINIB|nr:hypothetical protein FSP39_014778 [Pinctada imbricata]
MNLLSVCYNCNVHFASIELCAQLRRQKLRTIGYYALLFVCGYLIISALLHKQSNLIQLMTQRVRPDSDKQACVHPKLNPWDKSMMKHFYHIPTPKCGDEEDWVTVGNGSAWVTTSALKKHGDITCRLSYIGRKDDFEITWFGDEELKGTKPIKIKEDFFRAKCSAADGDSYNNVHAGVAYKPELHTPYIQNQNGMNLNVLMIGFDSVSHMTFIRKLQKSYDYFKTRLQGLVLNGYNIVGDGTPQAFIPMLTGQTELELPVALKRVKKKDFVDVYPMVWKEYKKRGYITTFGEDFPQFGMFTHRHVGFKVQPTDHFMRPFYLATYRNMILKFGLRVLAKNYDLCLGNQRKSKIFMDYIRQLYQIYPKNPKFTIGFLGDMSHDDHNAVETADEDLLDLMKELHDTGKLNDTILIVMSDHGARFNSLRAELQGKHEERLPFFGFAFPPWFKTKYPEAYRNFELNVDRLSTPFDIHETFKSIINFDGAGQGDVKNRGISLFKEIPKSRTCHHADIPTHWCACLNWYAVSKDDAQVVMAAKHVISSINNYVSIEKKCATLRLHNITRALKFLPDMKLIKFHGAADIDGFNPEMSDQTFVDTILYQVWFYAAPSMGLFEATVTLNVRTGQPKVNMADVSRINKYGNDADCSYDSEYDIRKFCYCRK